MERLWSHLENFLFDPLEGLDDLEQLLWERRANLKWPKQARAQGAGREGWLRRGLLQEGDVLWRVSFFELLFEAFDTIYQAGFKRDLLSKVAELAASLPGGSWAEEVFGGLLSRVDVLPREMDRAWALASIARAVASHQETTWSTTFFEELVRRVRAFSSEEEQVRVCGQLAGALASFGAQSWVGRLFEELVDVVRYLREEALRVEASCTLSEQFLGYEQLRPELEGAAFVKHAAFLCLQVGATSSRSLWASYARRVHFVERRLGGGYEIVPETWERLLEQAKELDDWTYEERDLHGDLRWEVAVVPALLGLLGRDFCRADNRAWVSQFFGRLLESIYQLAPSPGRERALRALLCGLSENYADNERETMGWVQHILERGVAVDQDPSLVYEGVFLGFLEQGELEHARQTAEQITRRNLRDRAFVRLALAWVKAGEARQSMLCLHEISAPEQREEAALQLVEAGVVVGDPVACSMLLREVVSLPGVAQKILRQIAQHPALPAEGREAILALREEPPLTHYASAERLHELSRLREHLPEGVYRKERRLLLGLLEPSDVEQEEKKAMDEKVMFDRPHSYGDGLYLTPREHITKNHFGEEVAGSRFTAWESFDDLWEEIRAEVESRLQKEGGIQVFALELPIDVGLTGVMPLEDAPTDALAIEIRNGQPSLYCTAPSVRRPTRTLTVVIGPSEVTADDVEGYEGHDVPHALYTIYPGKPAYPFPRCTKEAHERLQTSLRAAHTLLESGQTEEAKSVLYEAYRKLDGHDDAARYWSQHILIH